MQVQKTSLWLPGIAAIVDDIFVYGRTKQEHDTNLCAMLGQESHLRVRGESYFGNKLTHEGITPYPNKIKAI